MRLRTTGALVGGTEFDEGLQVGAVSHIYLVDQLGSVRQLVRRDTTAIGKHDFGPYGEAWADSGQASQRRFAGMHYLEGPNVYVTWNRMYDSNVGRWLSRDPIGVAGGANLYGYVGGDVLGETDSLGLYIDSARAACMRSPDLCFELFGTYTRARADIARKQCDSETAAFFDSVTGSLGDGQAVVGVVGFLRAPTGALARRATARRGQGPVVIGETMARVEAVAAKTPGAKILNDMPDFASMGMRPHEVTSSMMQYNRKWILAQMRSGRAILDIGADPNRAVPSIFYQMEQSMLRNYQKLHPGSLNVTTP